MKSLTQQIEALASGAATSSVLAERALAQAERFSDLNAFVALDAAHVMRQAELSDLRRRTGEALSPIDGIAIAVKDNYLTRDYPTTACSHALPLEPAGEDATIVANLKKTGAVIFGKTNMHEWAYGATNATSSFDPTRNPRDLDRVTGGSSGGSAAAVAAGIVPAALGSDTGGSVRIPAGACGIYGFKPTYGRASRHGILPLSWSLDAPGPMASTLEDIIHLLPFFCGADANDPATSHSSPLGPVREVARPKLVSLTGRGLERSGEVDRAVSEALRRCDAVVSQHEIEDIPSYFAGWETILHCEASSYHSGLLARNPSGFSPVTRAHLEAGNRISGVDLLRAQRIRSRFGALLDDLGDWDALVLPTLPVIAPRHGEDRQTFAGVEVATQDSMTWFCWIANFTGAPCISIPCGTSSEGLPIGLMLMGRAGRDEDLLAVARRVDCQINGGTQ